MIVLYTNMEDKDFDDAMVQMALDEIPCIENFEMVYVDEIGNLPGYKAH